jgi:hypothetical protein
MSAFRKLQADYQEWRRLAEAEGEAIAAGAWIDVCNFQNGLQELQSRIIKHTEAARLEWTQSEKGPAEHEENLRSLVRPLIDLERRNCKLLDEHMRAAQAEIGKFEIASNTLRRIHRSYVSSQPAAWTSFS